MTNAFSSTNLDITFGRYLSYVVGVIYYLDFSYLITVLNCPTAVLTFQILDKVTSTSVPFLTLDSTLYKLEIDAKTDMNIINSYSL